MTQTPHKSIYPTRDQTQEEINTVLATLPASARTRILAHIGACIIETVGEYEHGTAAVKDVEGVRLKQYAAVALDIFRVLCLTDDANLTRMYERFFSEVTL